MSDSTPSCLGCETPLPADPVLDEGYVCRCGARYLYAADDIGNAFFYPEGFAG